MIELVTEIAHNLYSLMSNMIQGVRVMGTRCFYFTRNTFRAHFNLLGKYTAPFEQEVLKKDPPSPRDLNVLGQIALTFIPLTILSWLLSVTIAPLLYNSFILSFSLFIRTSNLAFTDLPAWQIKAPQGSLAWYRILFGLPGIFLGIGIGMMAMVAIGVARVFVDSIKNTIQIFIKTINKGLHLEDKLTFDPFKSPSFQNYLLGFPGLAIGLLAGSLGLLIITSGRILTNSFRNIKVYMFKAYKLARTEPTDIDVVDKRGIFIKYILGFPGLIVGVLLGTLVFTFTGIFQIFSQSTRSFLLLFLMVTNKALDKDDKIDTSEEWDNSSLIRTVILGFPGLVLGVLAGTLGFLTVGLGRTILNSYHTLINVTLSAYNLVQKDPIKTGFNLDERNQFCKYFLGFPGILLASIPAFAALNLGILKRSIIEGFQTTKELFLKITEKSLPKREVVYSFEKRNIVDRFVFGSLGLLLGPLLGGVGFLSIGFLRIMTNSFKNAALTLIQVSNIALDEEDKFQISFDRKDRSTVGFYILGLPGFLIGGIGGAINFIVLSAGRTLTNSVLTCKVLTIKGMNGALHQPMENEDKRNLTRKYLFGLPGFVFGLPLAFIGFILAGFQRTIIESKNSAISSFSFIVKIALPKKDLSETNAQESEKSGQARLLIDYYLFGALGLLMGSVAGSLGFLLIGSLRIISNSAKSAIHCFITITNLALAKEDRFVNWGLEQDRRSKSLKYILGLPGILLGGLGGILGYLDVTFGRMTINSFKTAVSLTVSSMNLIRDENNQIKRGITQDSSRKPFQKYVLGFPGLVLGLLSCPLAMTFTLVQRTLIESTETSIEVLILMTNLALPKKISRSSDIERNPTARFGFGFPGLLFGIIPGTISVLSIGFVRIVTNSAKSFMRTFVSFIKIGLPPANKSIPGGLLEDDRSNIQRFILGFTGVVLGGIFGLVSLKIVILTRILMNSLRTAFELNISSYNLIRAEDEQLEGGIEKSISKQPQYIWGAPGFIFGALISPLTMTLAILERILHQSILSAREMTTSLMNVILTKKIENAAVLKRSLVNQYVFGMPGQLVGIMSGSIAFCSILIGRIGINSRESFLHAFSSLTNFAQGNTALIEQYGLRKDSRLTSQTYGFGLPGIVLGLSIGVIGFLTVGFVRVVAHSTYSAVGLFLYGINLAQEKNNQVKGGITDDSRSPFKKYVLGFPGLMCGTIFSLFGFSSSLVFRVMRESYHSINFSFVKLINLISLKENFRPDQLKKQSFVGRFILGFPGLFIGGIIGALGIIGEVFDRIFKESYESAVRVFLGMTNLTLDKENPLIFKSYHSNDERSRKTKYLLGLPGIIIGAVGGILSCTSILGFKLLKNNVISFKNLSGAILNASIGYTLFSGLSKDNRTLFSKLSGSIGYIACGLITLPMGVLVFSIKKIVPIGIGLFIGIFTAPLIGLLKGINQKLKKHRFNNESAEFNHSEIQKFKNIYSSLTPAGQLPENKEILENQTGKKGALCFLRKTLTLNTSTITEYTLDKVLIAYRNSANPSQFFEEELPNILDDVKEHYHIVSCLESNRHRLQRESQIDEIGQVIKNYLMNNIRTIPKVYSKTTPSWSSLFWGDELSGDKSAELFSEKNHGYAS